MMLLLTAAVHLAGAEWCWLQGWQSKEMEAARLVLAEAKRMTAATHSDGTRQKMTQHAVDTSLSWLIPEDIGESGLMGTIAELLSINPHLVRTTAQEKKERTGIVFTHTTPPCLPAASLLPPCFQEPSQTGRR